jgi:hypothetical protein
MRFTNEHIQQWREDGFVLIADFFDKDELSPILDDFQMLYQQRGKGEGVGTVLDVKKDGSIGASHAKQFLNFDSLPYQASSAINLISLHPALIDFARGLLGSDKVHLYQSHTWAKYTGEADYDQAFHCDFGNHTLTVPSDDVALRAVDFVIYLTDVTDEHGALHYVTKPDSCELLGSGALAVPPELQQKMKERERSGASSAGTLLAHGIDTFHRGTNLTAPRGFRFTMTAGYKTAGNDMIGFHTWQSAADRPWHLIFNNANAEQLACLGVPLPGDRFWTERTLRLTQTRWPDWNMKTYFDAAL